MRATLRFVFTRLVGAAHQDVVQGGPVHTGVALDQGPIRDGGQVIGPYRGQGAAVNGRTGVQSRRR